MRPADVVDRTVNVLKWPIGVLALALLPGVLVAFGVLLGEIIQRPGPIAPFVAGFVVYYLAWRFALRRPAWGSLVSTFEHELTHALFAWLTLHRVTGLRATWREGGEIRFRGRGNWLITIAPYFFPTLSLLLLLVLALIPGRAALWEGALLGVTVGYHGTSTWLETHKRQPDLARVTIPFAVLFLPTANLLAYGLLVAFAHEGSASLARFMAEVGDVTMGWLGRLF